MTNANKQLVLRSLEGLFNDGNMAVARETCAADVALFTHARPEPFRGPAGVIEFAQMIRTAFPDSRLTMHDLIAEDGCVAARYTLRGTHRGSLAGLPATGHEVAVDIHELFHIEAGRLQEVWLKIDAMQVLQQLGVMPASESLPRPLIMMSRARGRIAAMRERMQRVAGARLGRPVSGP